MKPFNKYKQIVKKSHPGKVLEYELNKKKIPPGNFAIHINEFPSTIYDIIDGRKKITKKMGRTFEKELGLEIGTFFLLQEYHELLQWEKIREGDEPNYLKFRTSLFADVGVERIEWTYYAKPVIHRVFTKGNEIEKEEIVKYYGSELVKQILINDLHQKADLILKQAVFKRAKR